MYESALTLKIKKALQEEGCYCEKIHGGPMQASGIPDLIGCVPSVDNVPVMIADAEIVTGGTFFGLEVKLPGKENNVTKIQRHTLDKIEAAGGITAVVTSVRQAIDAIYGEGAYDQAYG